MSRKKFAVLEGKEELIEWMILNGNRITEISREVNVSYSTISKYIMSSRVFRETYFSKSKYSEGQVVHTEIDEAAKLDNPPVLEELAKLEPEITTKEGVRKYLKRRELFSEYKNNSVKASSVRAWNRHK